MISKPCGKNISKYIRTFLGLLVFGEIIEQFYGLHIIEPRFREQCLMDPES